jgi:ureidoglycolate lyase
MTLKLHPLTAAEFQPFGDVVETSSPQPLVINQGFALRYNDLANIDVATENGRTNTSLFVAKARIWPIEVNMMERHPLGSQLFFPLRNAPWAVVVCHDPEDVHSFRAFKATGQQGVNYAKNTWHFPLIVFEDDARFLVVDRKGPGVNLVEHILKSTIFIHA